ncbi:MAG: D-inositol-3-phosphate glycosyltransferase [Anaerolineae bacterium]|nr:D-inositol-3-phosphate glycosyltransferase [Anaerolineae bacterium]
MPPKIGLIIYGNLNILSGGYLYDKKLVEHLRAHRLEVRVFSQPPAGYWGRFKANFDRRLCRQILDFAPDLLLQDELNHPSLFLLNRRLRRQLSAPIVSIVHHLYSSEPHRAWPRIFYRWVERQYLLTVDGFVFNSRATRQAVEQLAGRTPAATVAYPGKDNLTFTIDEAFIRRRCRREQPLQLVFVGNIIPRKSLHTLLEGLALLPPAGWQLTVVGDTQVDPAYFARIGRQVAALRLQNNVRFAGKLPADQLVATLQNSDLLAVPSAFEGFGIVYVEAFGAGLPVIAGRLGGSGEIVSHGETGYLVSPDKNEIAAAVGRFIHNRPLLTEMSLAAWRRYAEFPTWEQSMAGVFEYFSGQYLSNKK